MNAELRRQWRSPKKSKAFFDLSLIWVQIITAICFYYFFRSPLTFIVAFFLMGGAQHGLGLAGHEFAHYLVLPERKKWNDRIGDFLFLGPSVNSLALYRDRHFTHHRLFNTAKDTKTIYRRNFEGKLFLYEIIRSLSGLDYLDQVVAVLKRRKADREAELSAQSSSIAKILFPIAITQIVIAGIFIWISPFIYFGLWLFPLVTVNVLFSKFRSSVEHLPLRSISNRFPEKGFYHGTEHPFVRTVKASWIERLFICRINFCYHAEHHLYPDISYQYLPQLRKILIDEGSLPAEGIEKSYSTTLYKFWRNQ